MHLAAGTREAIAFRIAGRQPPQPHLPEPPPLPKHAQHGKDKGKEKEEEEEEMEVEAEVEAEVEQQEEEDLSALTAEYMVYSKSGLAALLKKRGLSYCTYTIRSSLYNLTFS